MGFRADIPMGDFAKTNPHLAEAFGLEATPTLQPKEALDDSSISRSMITDSVVYKTPGLLHYGAVSRSTSQALCSWPLVVWDVNGYYYALGVGFRASRKQLLRAYEARGGQEDEYLTYVFSQLLSASVRRAYDAQPLGVKFLDRYVEMDLKRRALQVARERRAAGIETTPAEVLDEWGFVAPDKDHSEVGKDHFSQLEGGETLSAERVDIPKESGENTPKTTTDTWPYNYYGWRLSTLRDHVQDLQSMQAWQEAIAAECHRQRAVVSFAVGLIGHSRLGRMLTLSVESTTVVFISTEHVGSIDELAVQAVQRLTNARG